MSVKSRKVGNATVVTVLNEFAVPLDTRFEPTINENGDLIYKRIANISKDENRNIEDFMDQFKPLMEKLKDK